MKDYLLLLCANHSQTDQKVLSINSMLQLEYCSLRKRYSNNPKLRQHSILAFILICYYDYFNYCKIGVKFTHV